MTISQEVLNELKVRLTERMLGAELVEHLGYKPQSALTVQKATRCNGRTRKVLKGTDGAVPIDFRRDRNGSLSLS